MKTSIFLILLTICLSCESPKSTLPLLSVSDNGHFLMTEDGAPFFWLGDTGWLLFSKLNREEADAYMTNRARLGFNVIQVMVLHDVKLTNVYGDSALVNGDVSKPYVTEGDAFDDDEAYDYWDHVDYMVHLAAQKGLYMAMVPVWGSNVKHGDVSLSQAKQYASWLASRYANCTNVIWLNGGDTKGSAHTEIWNAIGQNIKANTTGQLVSFHPFGRMQSSDWFHDADWLDFNMFQSGHRRYDQDDSERAYGQDNWKYVRDDYSRTPVKPTLDGEPSYESIPQGLHDPSEPYWDANDVRRYAYWSVFAGACGFTYGHNAIMQMHKPGDADPAYGVREYWTEALNATGASQMHYLKSLMLSVDYFDWVPDQSLIASKQGEHYDYQIATRGEDYAFIYTYNGREIAVNLGRIKGANVKVSWFNPRNGAYAEVEEHENKGTATFNPPGEVQDGNDWVLVLKSV